MPMLWCFVALQCGNNIVIPALRSNPEQCVPDCFVLCEDGKR
jgi:hypothetical protein